MLQNVVQKISSMNKLMIAGYPVHPLVLAGAGLALIGSVVALTLRRNKIAGEHGYGGDKIRMVNTPSPAAPATDKAF